MKLKLIKIKGKIFSVAMGILWIALVISVALFIVFSLSPSFTGFFAFNPSFDEPVSGELASDSDTGTVLSLDNTSIGGAGDSADSSGGIKILVKGENKSVSKRSGSGGGGGSSGGGGGSVNGGGAVANETGEGNNNGTGNTSNKSEEESNKNKNLSIILLSPGENSGGNGKETVFSYELLGESADKCSLIIDDSIVGEHKNVSEGINNLTANLTKGKHSWEISCEFNNSVKSSLKRRIMVIATKNRLDFIGDLKDIERVENFSLDKKGFGLIKFLGTINLSNCEDMEDYVIMDKNFISINSEKMSELNRPAAVTFYGLEFKNPIVLRDGKTCQDCQVISKGGEITFKVNHFSNYSLSENSALLIWDGTVEGSIVFYANYTNVTSGAAIEGANCTVNYGDGLKQMDYSGGLYLYNSSSSGTGTATVNCSAADYTEFILTDHFTLTSWSRVNGARVTAGDSEGASADEPESIDAYAGNLTYITLYGFSTTLSWQGYYGNVSGTIQLADGNDKVLYNWSDITPNGEVYATRAFDANFAAVSCAGATAIASEESSMGQNSEDADSISSTFNQKSHPPFFVGSIEIPINNCSSVNLFDSGGEQSSSFYEVLLEDDSNMIYASLLENDQAGFDGGSYDFEMIVLENGHGNDTATTLYYFYLELG